MNTSEKIDVIEKLLDKPPLPKAENLWQGADVVISSTSPPPQKNANFYPEFRFVVTPFALELSWLFEKLRDTFNEEELIDGCSKIEFYGRLANAANRYIRRENSPHQCEPLLKSVLHESRAILDEINEGEFAYFALASGNEIADDYVDKALHSGFIGTDASMKFLSDRKAKLHDED